MMGNFVTWSFDVYIKKKNISSLCAFFVVFFLRKDNCYTFTPACSHGGTTAAGHLGIGGFKVACGDILRAGFSHWTQAKKSLIYEQAEQRRRLWAFSAFFGVQIITGKPISEESWTCLCEICALRASVPTRKDSPSSKKKKHDYYLKLTANENTKNFTFLSLQMWGFPMSYSIFSHLPLKLPHL